MYNSGTEKTQLDATADNQTGNVVTINVYDERGHGKVEEVGLTKIHNG